MLLFFFLLLMLAMAWGVVDHFQSMLLNKAPPAEPAPIERQAAQPQPPPELPSTFQAAPDQEADDGTREKH